MPFKIITSKFNVVISLPKHLIFMGNIHASNILTFSLFILANFMCKTHLPLHLCLYIYVLSSTCISNIKHLKFMGWIHATNILTIPSFIIIF